MKTVLTFYLTLIIEAYSTVQLSTRGIEGSDTRERDPRRLGQYTQQYDAQLRVRIDMFLTPFSVIRMH